MPEGACAVGQLGDVLPAALVAGITFSERDAFVAALGELTREFGPVEMESPEFAFDMTDYYNAEMGENLKKVFFCFRRPVHMESLPDIKLRTNAIERRHARGGGKNAARRVNIDPGYVTLSKLVLATTKDYSHRISIGGGIYAEVTLRFHSGAFIPLETTYPDYRTPLALAFFNQVRDFVKRNSRAWTRETASRS
jgi:hypothetical protein